MRGAKPHLRQESDPLQSVSAPRWLSKDAKAEWRRVMPILSERRILTEADLGGLENYCVAIGQVREMERELQKHGHVVEMWKADAEGAMRCIGLRRNPAVGIQADAMTRARLLATELGLTPVSRSRPTIRDDGDADSLLD